MPNNYGNRGGTGGKRPGAGRKKGSQVKCTTALKEAVVTAATLVGQDGKGKGGLIGYLKDLAINEKKAFAGLLGKAMPLLLTGDKDDPLVIQIVKHADSPASE